jgi:hypothetical protein
MVGIWLENGSSGICTAVVQQLKFCRYYSALVIDELILGCFDYVITENYLRPYDTYQN